VLFVARPAKPIPGDAKSLNLGLCVADGIVVAVVCLRDVVSEVEDRAAQVLARTSSPWLGLRHRPAKLAGPDGPMG
jgi:hypothetical protein